jgi:hypothetical protein
MVSSNTHCHNRTSELTRTCCYFTGEFKTDTTRKIVTYKTKLAQSQTRLKQLTSYDKLQRVFVAISNNATGVRRAGDIHIETIIRQGLREGTIRNRHTEREARKATRRQAAKTKRDSDKANKQRKRKGHDATEAPTTAADDDDGSSGNEDGEKDAEEEKDTEDEKDEDKKWLMALVLAVLHTLVGRRTRFQDTGFLKEKVARLSLKTPDGDDKYIGKRRD